MTGYLRVCVVFVSYIVYVFRIALVYSRKHMFVYHLKKNKKTQKTLNYLGIYTSDFGIFRLITSHNITVFFIWQLPTFQLKIIDIDLLHKSALQNSILQLIFKIIITVSNNGDGASLNKNKSKFRGALVFSEIDFKYHVPCFLLQ